jgi:hypothetical protein
VATGIIKTVILAKEDVSIAARPGSKKFTARNDILICCVMDIKIGINSSCTIISALVYNI